MKPGRPAASIGVDGRRLNGAEAALVGLRIRLANDTHHTAEIVLWPRSKFAGAAVGAPVSISLGADGGEEDVLSGEIVSSATTARAATLTVLAATVQLSRLRRSQTYLSQTVADIVRDLAGPLDIDEIEADRQLDAYSVDTRRSVWGHLIDLARLCGAEVGCSAGGGLRFVPVRTDGATRQVRYGATLLGWQVAQAHGFDADGVAPHGAASELGADHWHWLTHDPLGADAKPSRIVGAFRTRDAADALGTALAARATRTGLRGEALIVGEAALRPGEVVAIADLPADDPGALRVTAVHHVLGPRGFLTRFGFEGGAGGPSVSLP